MSLNTTSNSFLEIDNFQFVLVLEKKLALCALFHKVLSNICGRTPLIGMNGTLDRSLECTFEVEDPC